MVVLTTFRDVDFRADPRALVFQQSSIVGSRYASRYEFALAAELVERGDVRPVVTEAVGADGVDAVHDSLIQGKLLGRGALLWA
jgi:propanol-preferring alcohol dehydrogenase